MVKDLKLEIIEKAKLEQAQAVENEKAKIQTVISDKFAQFDKEKQEQQANEYAIYTQKIQAIEKSYETKKQAFEQMALAQVAECVEKEFGYGAFIKSLEETL